MRLSETSTKTEKWEKRENGKREIILLVAAVFQSFLYVKPIS